MKPSLRSPTSKFVSGFSLIELLLLMGVVGCLSVACFVVFPQVRGMKLAREEVERLEPTVVGLQVYRKGLPTHSAVPTVSELVQSGLLMPEAVKNGDWVSIEEKPVGLVEKNQRWVVVYSDVGPSFCGPLVTIGGAIGRFSAVTINGENVLGASDEHLYEVCRRSDSIQVDFTLAEGTELVAPVTPSDSTKPRFVDPNNKRWGTNEGM